MKTLIMTLRASRFIEIAYEADALAALLLFRDLIFLYEIVRNSGLQRSFC